jgi:hypothetical protein
LVTGNLAEELIKIVTLEHQTTDQIMKQLNNDVSYCPDEAIRGLNRLRKKGIIIGEIDHKDGMWRWWKQ